jgi:hypothetical protein
MSKAWISARSSAARATWSPAAPLRLIAQAADALDAAHAAGLVHRDVKPGNILIGSDAGGEHAYVCDFGLARHVSSVSSLTGDRGFVGTIDYVPPEQIHGGAIDSRTDVYSLGCVLFECLAGSRPFERESELSVVFAHLNEPPPRIAELRPELPVAFDAVFATALAKAPEERFNTCGALALAAQAAAQGRALARPKGRRRGWLAGAAIVLAGAAALGALLATHGGDSPPPAISQTAIAGMRLGRDAAFYKQRLGGSRASTLDGPRYPFLAFQQPQIAVYFPSSGARSIIITTWNKRDRTARGIGPCSTVAELKKAYGSALKPSAYSQSTNGIAAFYLVGPNLLFAVNRARAVVQSVALYRPGPKAADGSSPESYAGFVASDETQCLNR